MKFSSKICIPIRPKNMDEAINELARLENLAEIIEIWVDGIVDLELEKLNLDQGKPKLIVCKTVEEQGEFRDDSAKKIQILQEACRLGAAYVDTSIDTSKELIENLIQNKSHSKVIVSYHDFQETPDFDKLEVIFEQAQKMGADIIKIATMVNATDDVAKLVRLMTEAKFAQQEKIIIGMGEMGKVTRVMGCYLGNELTFASLDLSGQTAPGQLSLADLLKLKNIL